LGKGQIGEIIFHGAKFFPEIGWKSETEEMHHCLMGMDAPGCTDPFKKIKTPEKLEF